MSASVPVRLQVGDGDLREVASFGTYPTVRELAQALREVADVLEGPCPAVIDPGASLIASAEREATR